MPTPNLGLPQLAEDQAQKHVTVNEALLDLDALVQLSVLDRSLAAPPGSPAQGARYLVAAGPTGAWANNAGHLAAYLDGAWRFFRAGGRLARLCRRRAAPARLDRQRLGECARRVPEPPHARRQYGGRRHQPARRQDQRRFAQPRRCDARHRRRASR